MDRTDILARMKTIIQPYTKDAFALETLNEDTDFIKDLKINSANLVDIVLDTEEAFGIEIDNEAMEKMLNIRNAIDIIVAKMPAQ